MASIQFIYTKNVDKIRMKWKTRIDVENRSTWIPNSRQSSRYFPELTQSDPVRFEEANTVADQWSPSFHQSILSLAVGFFTMTLITTLILTGGCWSNKNLNKIVRLLKINKLFHELMGHKLKTNKTNNLNNLSQTFDALVAYTCKWTRMIPVHWKSLYWMMS